MRALHVLALCAMCVCTHAVVANVSVPANTTRVALLQFFDDANFVLSTMRQSSSISNLFFPFVDLSLAYRQNFGSRYSSDSFAPANATFIAQVPYCTLSNGFNCIFPGKTYRVLAYTANGTMFQLANFPAPTFTEHRPKSSA
eukprot:m.10990 g.10990  ORF g.10990 m.10990 type:complete len:142 (+) comp2581_c0_seq2:489-914(+)